MAHALYDAAFADEDASMSYEDDSINPRGGGGKFAGMEDGGGGGGGNGGGLGSLADELAGAIYDSDDGDGEEEGCDSDSNGDGDGVGGGDVGRSGGGGGGIVNGGEDGGDRDGSEYGDLKGFAAGISFSLEDKIEKLAVRNKMIHGEEDGEIIPRLMEGLQKLAPQSSLEMGSTRLITAHSALATHILHQARSLRDLSLSITPSSLPTEDTSDLLLPLTDLIPRPTSQILTELAILHSLTLSLVSQLSFLSDTLQMARQSSNTANRKLRVAKEACADWKSELEQAERSRRWIEDGDWDLKCRTRNAANVCAEVTGGFEDVCRGFEERLKAQSVIA